MKKDYFFGWYFKLQSDTQTLAIIPAIHQSKQNENCSIQVISEKETWNVEFPKEAFLKKENFICIEKNKFGKRGIHLEIDTSDIKLKGNVLFGARIPLKYDIMGPFAWISFMECKHYVGSIRHLVNGTLTLNGELYSFQNALGYWEGDSGSSFPKEYAWTQCFFQNGSIMLSVADIPMFGFHFTGVIGVVFLYGKEFRLATYLGAKVIQLKDGVIRIIQGEFDLEVRVQKQEYYVANQDNQHLCSISYDEKALKAPIKGSMQRTIHENLVSNVYYRFQKGGQLLFAFESDRASFEYEYNR